MITISNIIESGFNQSWDNPNIFDSYKGNRFIELYYEAEIMEGDVNSIQIFYDRGNVISQVFSGYIETKDELRILLKLLYLDGYPNPKKI
jgi:hypothetical protein